MFSGLATIALVVLVIRPFDEGFHHKDIYGTLVAFIAMLLFGPYFLCLRTIKAEITPVALFTRIESILCLGILSACFHESWAYPTLYEWLLLFGAALGFLLGIMFRIMGFSKNPPAIASILANWQIAFDLLFQWVFLKGDIDVWRAIA